MTRHIDFHVVFPNKQPDFNYKKFIVELELDGLRVSAPLGEWSMWRISKRAYSFDPRYPFAGTLKMNYGRSCSFRGASRSEMFVYADLWWDALTDIGL